MFQKLREKSSWKFDCETCMNPSFLFFNLNDFLHPEPKVFSFYGLEAFSCQSSDALSNKMDSPGQK